MSATGHMDGLPFIFCNGRVPLMDSPESQRLSSSLEHLATQGADVGQVTAAIISAWTEIETALIPIVGKRGVAALYERSLYLTRVHHPWLAAVPQNVEAHMDLPALEAVLARQERGAAAAGGGALLQALYELLGSLIGSSLAERLLRTTWSTQPKLGGLAAQDNSL